MANKYKSRAYSTTKVDYIRSQMQINKLLQDLILGEFKNGK